MVRPAGKVPQGEALNVAISIAHGGGLADAYRLGQGPTAHVMPTTPLLAGGVYHLFGVLSPLSEAILACCSLGLAIGTYFILYRAFGHLGSSQAARLSGFTLACVLPTYLPQEAVEFRLWEGGLAVFLCALFFERFTCAISRQNVRGIDIVYPAVLAALVLFVNPVLGVAVYVCAVAACCQRLTAKQSLAAIGVTALSLIMIFGPWVARNWIVMGTPVLSRSNAGLELALADYPGALDPGDPVQEYRRRILEIHPLSSDRAYQAMREAGGEVAYARGLGAETLRWMRSNPSIALRLLRTHFSEVLFPREWQFRLLGNNKLTRLRATLACAVTAAGLLGIGLALWSRRTGWIYPALIILTCAACLSLVQPVPRYTYLIYPLLVFCAGDALTSWSHPKSAAARSQPSVAEPHQRGGISAGD